MKKEIIPGKLYRVNGTQDLAICPESRRFIGKPVLVMKQNRDGFYLCLNRDVQKAPICLAKRNLDVIEEMADTV